MLIDNYIVKLLGLKGLVLDNVESSLNFRFHLPRVLSINEFKGNVGRKYQGIITDQVYKRFWIFYLAVSNTSYLATSKMLPLSLINIIRFVSQHRHLIEQESKNKRSFILNLSLRLAIAYLLKEKFYEFLDLKIRQKLLKYLKIDIFILRL